MATNSAEAQDVAKKFQEYVQSPALTDIAVDMEGFETYDVEPLAIPDLFAERPLIIFGKWRGKPKGTIRVTGLGGEGSYKKNFEVTEVAEATPSEDNRALRYLWARERVRRLSDYEIAGGEENRAAITALGLTYELLTKYTSFIAVHEVVRNTEGSAQSVDQPLPMPEGVSDFAVGGSVPEPELPVLLVLVLLLLALTPAGRIRIKGWLRCCLR